MLLCALPCPAVPCPALPCPAPEGNSMCVSCIHLCTGISILPLHSMISCCKAELQVYMHTGRLIGTHAHEVMSIMQHLMSNYDDEAGGKDGPVQVTMF